MAYKVKMKIKDVMKERGITQGQLSEMTGINQATISILANGTRDAVNKEKIAKIAEALDLRSISDLMEFEIE